jgi:NAD(P)-dependent dehydrogenase (short-subunit alcohol dehydrogenase family)
MEKRTMSFAGRVVAVTGAAGGIGRELCRHFAAEGAHVAALDATGSVHEVVSALQRDGASAAGAVADIRDATLVEQAFSALAETLGPLDVLVNNAGATDAPSLRETTPESWQRHVDVNCNGAFNCVYAVLTGMQARRTGSIVNVSSVNALLALGDPAYSAGKAAMIAMTRSLATELGPYGIRVNVVCPGTVRTPMWQERSAKDPTVLQRLQRWYPLGRIVEPHEVANAIAFLASDAASAITGAVLPIDCGLTAGNAQMTRELTVADSADL